MLFLAAGGEDRAIREALVWAKHPTVLMSYVYIKQKAVPIDEVFDMFPFIVLDSGAFTMFTLQRERRSHKLSHPKYLNEYLEFIERYKGKFYWVANYDVNLLVGDEQVWLWNEEFERLEKEGQRVCYVTHDYSLPYRNMYEYFDRYEYIGVAGDHTGSKSSVPYFQQVHNLAFQKKKYVHGFAMTNFVSFRRFPFFTADSTTYTNGGQFGTTFYWNGSFFETIDFKRKYLRKKMKYWCDKWDVDFKAFCDDDTDEVFRFSIKAWQYNVADFNRKTVDRQWWLSEEDKIKIRNFDFL